MGYRRNAIDQRRHVKRQDQNRDKHTAPPGLQRQSRSDGTEKTNSNRANQHCPDDDRGSRR